jgi:hypothetical protein
VLSSYNEQHAHYHNRTSSYFIYLKFILILSSYLCSCIQNCPLLSNFLTKILHAFFISLSLSLSLSLSHTHYSSSFTNYFNYVWIHTLSSAFYTQSLLRYITFVYFIVILFSCSWFPYVAKPFNVIQSFCAILKR